MGTIVVHDLTFIRHKSYAYRDNSIPELEGWHPEAYVCGDRPANYPVPAIPLAVKYDYRGCVNIDDVTDPDDPIIVWMYDSWNQVNC